MDRTPPGESLPPSQDDIDISRADLETAADAAGHFGCDQARTRTEKPVTRSGLKGTRIASPSFRALRAPGRRTVSRLTLLPPLAPAAMHCGHRQHSVSHAKPRYGGASERRSVHLHGPPMVEFAPDSLLEGAEFEPSVPLVRPVPEWLEKGARALCAWSAECAPVKCAGGTAILRIEWSDADRCHARTLYRNPARRE